MKYLKITTEKDINPGIIAVIQSFGNRINFHPHLHFLVTEGGIAVYQ
ncbi:MAG: transposase [Candidatus Aminicenantes bacterium]|nr:transposase [Candidatus Aminicenantes bacterium]